LTQKLTDKDEEINFGIEVVQQVPVPAQPVKGQKQPVKQEFTTRIDQVAQQKLFSLQVRKVLQQIGFIC